MSASWQCHLISSLSQVVGGELEPEEKEELAEKIGKLLQRDRMGVRTQLGFCWAGASSYVLSASTLTSRRVYFICGNIGKLLQRDRKGVRTKLGDWNALALSKTYMVGLTFKNGK